MLTVQRKLIKIGRNSRCVVLPRDWLDQIERDGADRDGRVELVIQDGQIVIRPVARE